MAESKNYSKLFNSWRLFDSYATIFSITSLLLAMINYEIDIFKGRVQGIQYADDEH